MQPNNKARSDVAAANAVHAEAESELANRDSTVNMGAHSVAASERASVKRQPASSRFEPGTKIDRYILVKCIGRGGMGEVYLAQHTRLASRYYAIKFLKSDFSDSHLHARFEAEINAMERLKHPNVVYAEDAGDHEGIAYLVTEFVDGYDLSALVAKTGPLQVCDAAEMIRQAALGLQHAHECCVVHRDLKPSNLVLSREGAVKILDLGLARIIEPTIDHNLTDSLQLLGTPDYMSPEQCHNAKNIDIRSDIYSLGCTLYCLLCGRPPFGDEDHASVATKLTAHLSESPAPISQIATEEIPAEIVGIVSRMLDKDPERRFQTPVELAESLGPFTAGCDLSGLLKDAPDYVAEAIASVHKSTTNSGKDLPAMAAPASRWNRLAVTGVLAAVCGLAVVAAIAYTRPPADDTPIQRSLAENVARNDEAAESSSSENTGEEQSAAGLHLSANPASFSGETDETAGQSAEQDTRVQAVSFDSADLSRQGYAFLETYCMKCHGDDLVYPALDLRDRATLLSPTDASEDPFLVPGKPDESRLWLRASDDMPPENQPQPSETELAVFQHWIEAGAVFPEADRSVREFVGERSIIELIAQDIQTVPQADRGYTRYFSVTHLWNDAQISDEQLRVARAAVSKLLNSLSSQQAIAVPTLVGKDALLLRIDLRDYGWTEQDQWLTLLRRYPWGLQLSGQQAESVYQATASQIPYLRADWFVHAASRPPLYHDLVTLPGRVGLPEDLQTLEDELQIDLRSNIERNQVARAGFSGQKSGVSDHNRIVERHSHRNGYFWSSYDSAGDIGRQNFANFPLGPKFEDVNQTLAFEHDGGEFIVGLPNGMQFYFLATAQGKRIDAGPQSIVRDPNQFSGSFDIVNGISCMGCHKRGMLPAVDVFRSQWQDTGDVDARRGVLALYPTHADMNAFIAADRGRFLQALEQACGSLIRSPGDDREIANFPEPITATARHYDRNLDLEDVARELGLPTDTQIAASAGIAATAQQLDIIIKSNARLTRQGLGPLAVGDYVTRQQWERAFPTTTRELNLGMFQMIR